MEKFIIFNQLSTVGAYAYLKEIEKTTTAAVIKAVLVFKDWTKNQPTIPAVENVVAQYRIKF